jgi:nucleolar GTP-binding protein
MYKIPTILTSDEILDKAFRSAGKVQVVSKNKAKRNQKTAIAKVRKASKTISSTLNRYIKSFPSFNSLPKFYYELFDVSLGIDGLKKSLGAINWCKDKVQNIADESVQNISSERNYNEMKKFVSGAYGRLSSVVKQVADDLEFLDDARRYLIKAPEIDVEKPTIVIAGAPNVGKSLFVGKISSAKPKIASYPFTTKGISVGHFESKGIIYQVIDTPGLLDREMEKRNDMEIKATLALSHLATIIVFVLDPTEYCGYSLDSQLKIMEDIKSMFPKIQLLEIENKADIQRTDSENLKISALEGEGIDDLIKVIITTISANSL